ncbi:16S rRNA (guanine(966)-N(2))-methyltransferase RsmD [Nonlabens ponticola]|uniref:16S rRNA (Guanine(966)-N(2))-methyltransferase RsmD n=1 Tax=Nonlabens ponticola TaxID=2496866 RepID=A0A3S9MZN5_9FLAO|nr:16S rRNA (guanine(966)-N(2))-methyltransferase RsmD [Nonlabens ponticola]AZQ44627.1 16S rRNA (guanine(966)-N(2))-methyltransferase RsmD [Nonlabens ponticola]
MRIISGIHKGRRIQAPKKLPVRPTTDMAKEALFNILRHQIHIHDISVLELFAGSGNMSYEFASRGAGQVTAVDSHMPCVAFIQKTATELDLPIDTLKADAFKFLEKHTGSYDIIFADPPYAIEQDEFLKIPEFVASNKLLKDDGLLIIEHSKHTDLSNHETFDNARRYGGTVFSFFKPASQEE